MNRTIRQRGAGFTLIELLVVIAIIAILAAILFPVFAKAREKARQSTCLSNQRQIVAAILMYAQDYGEKLPSSTSVWSSLNVPNGILHCPSAPKTPTNSYGYNLSASGTSMGKVVSPTSAMMTADCASTNNLIFFSADINKLHSGMVVASYLDGHVAATPTLSAGITSYNLMPTVTVGSTLNSLPWRSENGSGTYYAGDGCPPPCINEYAGGGVNPQFGLSLFLDTPGQPLATATMNTWWSVAFDYKAYCTDGDLRYWSTFMVMNQVNTNPASPHTPNATPVPANGSIICRLDEAQWNWGSPSWTRLLFGQSNYATLPQDQIATWNVNVANLPAAMVPEYTALNQWNHVVINAYNGKIECNFANYPPVNISTSYAGGTGSTLLPPNALVWYNNQGYGGYSYICNLAMGFQ